MHESGHATSAKHRLDPDLASRFRSAAYAAEECAVEILGGFVLANLGMTHHPPPDHAAWSASWLKVLKNDPRAINRAIVRAASAASKAADYLLAFRPESREPVDTATVVDEQEVA